MHGPCGQDKLDAYCNDSHTKKCTKGIPKIYSETTVLNNKGSHIYKRPFNGRAVIIRDINLMNVNVILYNLYLLANKTTTSTLRQLLLIISLNNITKQ